MRRALTPLSLVPLLGVGCSGLGISGVSPERLPNNAEAGEAVACLGTQGGVVSQAEPGERIAFEGVVLRPDLEPEEMDDTVAACQGEVDTVVSVVDEDGTVWTLGWSWRGPWGGMVMLDPVEEDDLVEVTFRRGENGESSGFVIRRDAELAMVLESGIDGPGLSTEDLPGDLEVTRGVFWAYGWSDDGTMRQHFTVDFSSDSDEVRVPPDGDDSVTVEDDSLTVCTIAAWMAEDDDAPESSEVSWVMF